MSGKSSQRKGRTGEIELAHILQSYGYPVQAVSFGNTPDLTGLPGVHIEAKRVERLNVSEAMTQAVRDSEKFHDGIPILFHRRNRQEWLTTMRLTDFMAIYEQAKMPDNVRFLPMKGGKQNDTQQGKGACGPYEM